MQPCAPRKFKILVAALKTPSDPSRGPSGNPTVSRTGFTLQQILTENGTSRIGGPVVAPPPPSPAAYTAKITVTNPDYWDPAVAGLPPFYDKEEISLFGQYLTASDEFGGGLGSGTGPTAAIATQLADSLNVSNYPGVAAVAIGSDVYITSLRPDATLPIKATNDYSAILGGISFDVYGPGGILLSVGPYYRQTYFITKSAKTQSPPVSLP